MAIECGVRITKDVFDLFKKGMTLEMKENIRSTMRASLISQKKAFDTAQQSVVAKSFGDNSGISGDASKGVELYCSWKGMGQRLDAWTDNFHVNFGDETSQKSIGRILGVLSTRVTCGIRTKEFVQDLPLPMFEQYIDSALAVFPDQLEAQIKQYHDLNQSETVALKSFGSTPDGEDAAKGIEVYCSIKSMCGG